MREKRIVVRALLWLTGITATGTGMTVTWQTLHLADE